MLISGTKIIDFDSVKKKLNLKIYLLGYQKNRWREFLSLPVIKKNSNLHFLKLAANNRCCLLTLPETHNEEIWYIQNSINIWIKNKLSLNALTTFIISFQPWARETMSIYFKKEQEALFILVCVVYLYLHAWKLIESTYIKEHRSATFVIRALQSHNSTAGKGRGATAHPLHRSLIQNHQ